jgi:hypothetical protein
VSERHNDGQGRSIKPLMIIIVVIGGLIIGWGTFQTFADSRELCLT